MIRKVSCFVLISTAWFISCRFCLSQGSPPETAKPIAVSVNGPFSPADFDASALAALQSMKDRAESWKVGGVAVVAYFEGDRAQSWTSKMLVVGRMKDNPTATDKGANLLGIAYAKAAEMADTLKDSGSQSRLPMTGEFGWEGGVIVRVKTGYVIAAFSGGKSEDDVAVSRAGAARISKDLARFD